MPNWAYLVVSFLYHLGLALWLGGGVVLGALVAPTLFRSLENRSTAGALFGQMLRKYARLRVVAIALAAGAAIAKKLFWEQHTLFIYSRWIVLRWVCLAVMAGLLVYEIFYLERAIALAQKEMASDAASKPAFDRLHKRAEWLMKISMLAAVGALFFF
ncbi:MAG TPA: DUF4149 domain-containing protein [Thermoanaerobaculia bacterium]|nr:DUF4149 domain-containing protein [Thermoanaerobaculia bacterium]